MESRRFRELVCVRITRFGHVLFLVGLIPCDANAGNLTQGEGTEEADELDSRNLIVTKAFIQREESRGKS